jgi:hypothetical protein
LSPINDRNGARCKHLRCCDALNSPKLRTTQNSGPVGNGSMSIRHDQFDFAAFLRAEARDAEADERTHAGDDAPIVSKQWLEPDSGALSGEAGKGTDDQNGNPGRRPDGIGIVRRTLKFRRRSALVSRSVKSPLTVVSPLRRNLVGAAALALIAVAIVVVLAHYLVLRPSNPRTDLSGTSKLASTNSWLLESPRLPPARTEAPQVAAPEGAPIDGSLNAIQPESVRDTVDPEIKLQGSSGAQRPESVPRVAFASVKKPASPENTRSDLPKLASTYSPPVAALPLPVPPIEAVPSTTQQSAPMAGSLNAIQPESVRDTVDHEIKLRGSYEAKTPESVPTVAFASVKTLASSENTPSSDLPKLASTYSPPVAARPLPVPPIEAVPPTTQQSAPIAGSLKAMQPESVRDTVDPEIKLQGSSEAQTPESVPRVAFASVKTPASSENAPSSDVPKLASTYSPPVAAGPLPDLHSEGGRRVPPIEAVPLTAQQRAPTAGSLNAIQPESVRDTVDPEIKLRGSSEVKTPESVQPVAFASVKTPASSENTPSSDLPKLASTYSLPVVARPLSVPPTDAIPPTTQQSAPPSRSARRTTASLSQSTPSSERKTTGLNPDTMQPHIGDVALRKHDQKPSKAPETRSCTAVIFSGYVQASADVKTGQLDVRKICADQHASFTVSLRCLVASVICPNLSH